MNEVTNRKKIHELRIISQEVNEYLAKKLKKEGFSNTQIAEQMSISESVVRRLVE